MPRLSILAPGDEGVLDAFLAGHAASSMFLRSNLRAAGLVDRDRPLEASYAAVWTGGQLTAVAAHAWNGMVLLQAPAHVAAAAQKAILASGREVKGLAGPHAQVVAARHALGLDGAATTLDSQEDLFELDLDALVVPAALAAGRVRCRRPRKDELPLLAEWRVAYCVEVLGATSGPRLRAACAAEIENLDGRGHHWLLLEDDAPVAYSAFNARLPDTAQVGGVYTPPALRGRGHARAAVAGSLLEARAEGATRAVLFTGVENAPARAAYLALGFRVVGDYGLVLFAEPSRPRLLAGLLADGQALWQGGAYFEAHEVWEEAWLAAGGVERGWLQGLIQAAAGMHSGMAATKRRALARLASAPDYWLGVNVAAVRRAAG